MSLMLMEDLSPIQLKDGWASTIQGFFMPTMWWMHTNDPYPYVEWVVQQGGVKKAYGIPSQVIYEAGSDRVMMRDPLDELKEAVALRPDVIQVHDLPLDPEDDESAVIQKLAVNRDVIRRYDSWLREHNLRERFLLLGVAQGDYPNAYAEEAEYISKHCDLIGIPVAGFMMDRKYQYLQTVLTTVAKRVPMSIQLMGYGLSNLKEVNHIAKVARQFEIAIWMEGSTIVRNSIQHQVLCTKKEQTALAYKSIAKVRGAEGFTKRQCFEYNHTTLKDIIAAVAISMEGG